MLVNPCDYKQSVTLIANSGVQFLDFAFTPQDQPHSGRFVRKTTNGPLLRLTYDARNDKYTLPASDDGAPEVVKPESNYDLSYSLQTLHGCWLPLPVLRCMPPRSFNGGPDNWARVHICKLDKPDNNGHSHRITLAFDTQIQPVNLAHLAPDNNDVSSGNRFMLAWRDSEIGEFLDQTWVDGWLRECFRQYALQQEGRTESEMKQALKSFEYQAHWLNLLFALAGQLKLPEITIVAESLTTPTIPVDLILDVGNTHTCGVIVEDQGSNNEGLQQAQPLQIRSLSEPNQLSPQLVASRLEFAQARFGKAQFSLESGRDNAFIWPSIVRIGDEACKLAMQRPAAEGYTGISSPRRYLWDDTPASFSWRFSQLLPKTRREPLATAFPLMLLMNDEGEPLYQLPEHERLPVFTPHYSRSSLMTHMLCELLAQAICQINSVNHRLRMGFTHVPRRLRTLILTLPCAMPKQERELFRLRTQQAVGLVWKALGWHPQDADFTSTPASSPLPEIHMEWDEASCGQLVWLYNEAMVNFAGQTANFFASLARPDRIAAPELPATPTLRIAALDIGGGTIDLAITRYQLDDGAGSNVKITPQLLFREGFKVAGDDLLLDIIRNCLLPALQEQLQKAGVSDTHALLAALFGESGRTDTQAILRQQTTLQLLIPAGHAILKAWETSSPGDPLAGLHAPLGALLEQPPGHNVIHYLQQGVAQTLPAHAPLFDVLSVPVHISFPQLQADLLAGKFSLTTPLHALCEAISYYCCDTLLISGRPACLPGVQALIRHLQPVPASRMVWMDHYRIGDWYPFSQQGGLSNPKSTAAVGAMLCSLALDLRIPRFNFNAAEIQAWSTVRYLGVLDDTSNTLQQDNVWYANIDLDNPGESLDTDLHFSLRGNLCLGFRQLENTRWPATPLYTLTVNTPELAKSIAKDALLNVSLQLTGGNENQAPQGFAIARAWLSDGTSVAKQQLTFKLNTLADRRSNGSHYWIDSGSVYLK